MSLQIKLQPQLTTFNKVKMVTGLSVELTTKGPGKTVATTAPQDATIEFYELLQKGGGDKATANRLIATLAFELTVDASGGDPKLNGKQVQPSSLKHEAFVRTAFVRVGSGARFHDAAPDRSSDFWLRMTIPQAVSIAGGSSFVRSNRLFLPWESDDEKNVLEIGAKLTIGGIVESDIKDNNVVTVPLEHKDVPRDGTGSKKDRCVGVGMVYPTVNSLWDSGEFPSAKKAQKMVPKTINVFLHDEVVANHAPVTLSEIATRLERIFVDAGLPKPTVTQKTVAEIQAAGFERRTYSRGTRWGCNAAKMIDPDSPLPTSGLSLDFFDFWVMWEPKLTPQVATADAESETIMDFDPTSSKKMVLFPVAVLPHSVTQTKACDEKHPTLGATEYQANYFATTLAHEIGHALGLDHGLLADDDNKATVLAPHPQGNYDLGPTTPIDHHDVTRGVMGLCPPKDGVFPLPFFGPVHTAVLRQRFT